MGLILQVGNATDMPKTPKNFPKCGNWKFQGFDTDDEGIPVTCGTGQKTGDVTTFAFLGLFLTKLYQLVLLG